MSAWAYPGNNWSSNLISSDSISQGYYVSLPSTDPADNNPSAQLENIRGDTIGLWISNFSIDFSMGGTYAQSMRLRQYMPRNLIQPVIHVEGQMPNSFQYQRLAEFVRESHYDTLFPQTLVTDQQMLSFTLFAGHLGDLTLFSAGGKRKAKMGDYVVQGKGPHALQHFRGYIQSIQRGAQQFINAPTYTFDFVPSYSYGDLYRQGRATTISVQESDNFTSISAGFEVNIAQPTTHNTVAPTTTPSSSSTASSSVGVQQNSLFGTGSVFTGNVL
jgi:hypothetical protein